MEGVREGKREKGRKRSVGHSHSRKKRLDRVEGKDDNPMYQVVLYKVIEFFLLPFLSSLPSKSRSPRLEVSTCVSRVRPNPKLWRNGTSSRLNFQDFSSSKRV